MEMDCIPAGMEMFPAADEEQWEFIKKVIDDCDYYLLIIGGRYGSLSSEGVSYTEMEFDYAVSTGKKVVALLHEAPETLVASKVELSKDAQIQLDQFRQKVSTGRLVRFWTHPRELAGLVALSLTKTIKSFPAVGWVRDNQQDGSELLIKLNKLRDENESLKQQVADLQAELEAMDVSAMNSGNDGILLTGWYTKEVFGGSTSWEYPVSWNQIISWIGPHLFEHNNEAAVSPILARKVVDAIGVKGLLFSVRVTPEKFQLVKAKLLALKVIKIERLKIKDGSMAPFWSLTEYGKGEVLRVSTIKSPVKEETDLGVPQS